jgi:hypothetical protein
MRDREYCPCGYQIGLRAALSTPTKTPAVANSTQPAWLCTPVFWQNRCVTCDPNRDAPPVTTENAATPAQLAAEPPPNDEDAVPAAALATPAGGPSGDAAVARKVARPPEIGGREGPDPTRYGDWELRGRCIDF